MVKKINYLLILMPYTAGEKPDEYHWEKNEASVTDEIPQQSQNSVVVQLPHEDKIDEIPEAPVCKPQIIPHEEPSRIVTLMESMGSVFGISQSLKLTKDQILDAKELCSIALKAFESENATLVGVRLNEALVCLGQTPAQNIPSHPLLNHKTKVAIEQALQAIESKDKNIVVDKIQEALVHSGFT